MELERVARTHGGLSSSIFERPVSPSGDPRHPIFQRDCRGEKVKFDLQKGFFKKTSEGGFLGELRLAQIARRV